MRKFELVEGSFQEQGASKWREVTSTFTNNRFG